MTGKDTVEALRADVDRIDDALHDLIMRRAEVVERIGTLKVAAAQSLLRPAREAEIVRRLIARHQGRFPKAVVVRVWREIISGMLALEGPHAVAVYMPDRGSGYLELARDHYGSYTPMTAVRSPGQVVRMVSEGSVTVGIVPMPDREVPEPWWVTLMGESAEVPRIIGRLPFAGPGAGRGEGIEALAIGQIVPEPTGYDRSWIALETPPDISRARIRSVLGAAGLEPTHQVATHLGEGVWRHLVEISGHVTAQDRRVARLVDRQRPVTRAIIVGGHPVPISTEELGE